MSKNYLLLAFCLFTTPLIYADRGGHGGGGHSGHSSGGGHGGHSGGGSHSGGHHGGGHGNGHHGGSSHGGHHGGNHHNHSPSRGHNGHWQHHGGTHHGNGNWHSHNWNGRGYNSWYGPYYYGGFGWYAGGLFLVGFTFYSFPVASVASVNTWVIANDDINTYDSWPDQNNVTIMEVEDDSEWPYRLCYNDGSCVRARPASNQ